MTAIPSASTDPRFVRIARSENRDSYAAAREVLDDLNARDAAFTVLYYSPDHEPAEVARALGEVGDNAFAGSSAGEISPRGFAHGTIVGMALHGDHVRATYRVVPRLDDFSLLQVSALPAELARQLNLDVDELDPTRHVWLLMLDGLSGREDFFTPFFSSHAPRLPLVGGSMAAETDFDQVTLCRGGQVLQGAGLVILLEYDRPFEVIHHTHLAFTEHWFEVTDTKKGGRTLTGLDGRRAIDVYAEALGVCAEHGLTMDVTGSAAFGLRFKGRPFPCSVMRAQDGELELAYSVQRGDKLNLLSAHGLVEKSETVVRDSLKRLREAGGDPQAMLAFHCLGRYLEAQRLNVVEELFDAMDQVPICGLNTYGEQFGSRHMNHSLCAVILG